MRSLLVLTVLVSATVQAQSPLLSEIRERLKRVAPQFAAQLTLPHARVQAAYVPDSIWYDTYNSGNWELARLETYGYSVDGRPLWDSAFNYLGAAWQPAEHTAYSYYQQGPFAGLDSLHLSWEYDNNASAFLQESRVRYAYTSLSGGRRLDVLTYDNWDTTQTPPQWVSSIRESYWNRNIGGTLQPDSAMAEGYDGTNWTPFGWLYFYYTPQGREDSSYGRVDLSVAAGIPGELRFYSKQYYDAQGRPTLLVDSLHVTLTFPPLSGSEVSRTYSFYPSPTASQPSRDSTYTRSDFDAPQISRTFYTYDAQGNFLVITYDTCRAPAGNPCGFTSRTRYSYIQVASSLPQAVGAERWLPNPLTAGQAVLLTPEMGKEFTLYDVAGRLVVGGQIPLQGRTLGLPPQPGIYLLRIDNKYQRLLLLP